jgi:hypothetical protein
LLDAAGAFTPGEAPAGGRAARAGFLATRQRTVPPAPSRRGDVEVRRTAMKVALGFRVVAFGGTASAARAGSPSTPAQHGK